MKLLSSLICGLFLAVTLGAEGPAPADFVVHTAAGVNFIGPMYRLAPDGTVRLGGERPVLIPGQDVVALRRSRLRLPPFPERNMVVLTNGDRIPLNPILPVKLANGRLVFQPLPGTPEQPLGVPRAFVALLWLGPPEGTTNPESLIHRLLTGKRPHDQLILRNGDQVEGTVTAIDPIKGIRIDSGDRTVEVVLTRLAALVFNTELQARLRGGQTTHVVLGNGGRLSFTTLQLDTGTAKFVGKTLFGARLEVPLDQTVAVEPRNSRVAHLSDLKPNLFEFTPFLKVAWPLAKDTAVTGQPIRLDGNTYDKGLGMHAQSKVVYDLGGKFRWFETLVGLDDHTGRRGRVRVRILVDGKEQNLGWDKELTGRDGPLAVRLNINKARALTLLVDFGGFGDVQAHVNWADARLIR